MSYMSIKNGVYCRDSDGLPLANGFLVPVQRYYDASAENRKPRFVDFKVQCEAVSVGEELPVVTVDLAKRELLSQILKQEPRFRIFQPSHIPKMEADLLKDVSEMSTPNTPCFARHGPTYLKEYGWVYVAGDQVIGLPADIRYKITPEVAAIHLVSDEMSSREAVEHLVRLLIGDSSEDREAITRVYLPLWLQTLFAAFRSEIEDGTTTTNFGLAVIGPHGTRKTSAVQMLSLLYALTNHEGHIADELNAASGGNALVTAITGIHDRIVSVDDATIAGADSKESGRREATVQTLVRFCCNTSTHVIQTSKTTTKSFRFGGGLVVTGEVPIKGASTNDRLIILPVKTALNSTSPEGRKIAANVFYHFVEWILPQLTDRISTLHQRLETTQPNGNLRLKQVLQALLWTLENFLDFVTDTTGIAPKTRAALYKNWGQLLTDLLDQQAELVGRIEKPLPEGNELLYLRRLYFEHQISIAPDWKKWDANSSAIIENDMLFIQPEYLLKLFSDNTPLQFTSVKALGKRLDELQLLVQQETGKNTIKKRKKRVYAINLSNVLKK